MATTDPTTAGEWRCERCGSTRWVAVSLNGGITIVTQCVPCGRIGGEVPEATR